MTFRSLIPAIFAALLPVAAQAHVVVENAYLRVVNPASGAAALYMSVRNHSDDDDRLFRAETDAAARVEIHTSEEDANGVVRMIELEEGIAIPSGETHLLEPGGDHIMLMGLTEPLQEGDEIEVMLFFDVWIPFSITVPVVTGMPMGGENGGGHGDGHGDGHGGGHGSDG